MRNLAEYPKLLRAIIKHCKDLSESLVIVDAGNSELPIIDVNEEFVKLTGYDEDEVLGKNPRFLQGPETKGNSLELIRQGLAEETIVTADVLNYKKDGTKFWNRLSLFPIKDRDEKVNYWAGIMRDVSPLIEFVNKESELNVMSAVIRTISDIVFNYLNYLQLFRINLEENAIVDAKLLNEYDDNYLTFLNEIKRLSDLDDFKATLLKKGINVLNIK